MARSAWSDRFGMAIVVAAAALVLLPSFLWGPAAVDSAPLNATWTEGFAEALREGQVYPRWLAGSFEGLGSPTFYFYPPAAFYLSGGLRALGLANGAAVNGAAFAALAASGLAMYAWIRWRGGPALWAALAYIAAPYHLTDFYVRAALAEFCAFAWLPLIALGIEASPRRWALPLLAVSFAGLCLTHLPMALLAGVFLIAPMIAWKTRLGRDWRRLVGYAAAGICAIALAGLYLVPAMTLTRWISAGLLFTPYYRPGNWSLLQPPPAVAGGGMLIFALLAAVSVAVAFGAGVAAWRARRTDALLFAGIALAAAVLGLGLAPAVWRLPLLDRVQFPWRLFAVMEFAAVAAAAGVARRRIWVVLAAAGPLAAIYLGMVAAFTQAIGHGGLSADWAGRRPDGAEYLPAGYPVAALGEQHRDLDLRPLRGPPVSGNASAVATPGGGLDITATAAGRIVARRFAFPGWRLEQAGPAIALHRSGAPQLIAFDAPGPGLYRLRRVALPEEQAGGAASLAGLLLLVLLGAASMRRRDPPSARTPPGDRGRL